MRRVVALFLPTFPTDHIRRRNGGTPARNLPIVTAMQEGNRRVLASVDDAARKLKLACGMTVAHAQTLVPDLIVEARPDEDEASLARLALWCTRYSPLVTPLPPDTIFIDVAGSAHLFKGEAALRPADAACRRAAFGTGCYRRYARRGMGGFALQSVR
jgi:protein ImuB